MSLIADILLVTGALGAAFYCFVLSRRLKRFNDLEQGVGGAIAVLSGQVDDMTRALDTAEQATSSSAQSLLSMTDRAEAVAGRLELLVASMHDLPVEEREEDPLPLTKPVVPSGADDASDKDVAAEVTLFRSRRDVEAAE